VQSFLLILFLSILVRRFYLEFLLVKMSALVQLSVLLFDITCFIHSSYLLDSLHNGMTFAFQIPAQKQFKFLEKMCL
jgi:hypothetical protein